MAFFVNFYNSILVLILSISIFISFEVHGDSIMSLEEAVSAVDGRLTVVNFTLSGQIQDVDTGLTALGDTVAELEGRMENVESELTSIEELLDELDTRLVQLEVAGRVC